MAEPSLSAIEAGSHVQFERSGYFFVDPLDSRPGSPVFNRVVGLRDGWKPPVGQGGLSNDASSGRTTDTDQEQAPEAGVPGERGDPRLSLRDEHQRERFDAMVAAGAPAGLAANLARDDALSTLFLAASESAPDHGAGLAKWLVHEVARARDEGEGDPTRLAAADLSRLVKEVDGEEISHHQGRGVLEALLKGEDFDSAVARLNEASDTGAIDAALSALIQEHGDKVQAYRDGKDGLLGFFVGQVMRQTEGRPDPKLVSERARTLLEA